MTTPNAEAYDLVRYIAGYPERPVKAAINRAHDRLREYWPFKVSRIEDIWYGVARLFRAEELDALRAAAAVRRQKIEAGRAATADLARVYLATAERLRSIDESFFGPEIARLERDAGALGPVDRPGASPGSVGNLPLSSQGGGDNG